MRYMLSRAARPLLTRLAGERTLYAFDFDGTLVPIAAQPDQVRMRERTGHLLGLLATRCPCIVISGRSRNDVLGYLRGVPLVAVVGNHGAEFDGDQAAGRPLPETWKASLEPALRTLSGAWIEDKGKSLAVHYRQSSRRSLARRKILAAAGELNEVRVFGGKEVVNLVPADAGNKGDALVAERERLHCPAALFFGDDVNDEEAFASAGTVGVRIGRTKNSRAEYYLRSQAEIDDCLELMLRLTGDSSLGNNGRCAP